MKKKRDEKPVLERDDDFKSSRLVRRAYELAKEQGRVDGKFRCLTCGMRHLDKWAAKRCCEVDED